MRHVALLYSVILTAARRVKSAELIDIANDAGVQVLSTVLSTGNLIVETDQPASALELTLERSLLKLLGKPIPIFVRRAPDWHVLVAANPFPDTTRRDPSRVAVRVMRRQPTPEVISRITASVGPDEHFAATDRALWLATPDQLSTTRLLRAVSANWVGEGTLRSASALAKITAALDD
jgi:uncharacterized protein (DUF1697 family)